MKIGRILFDRVGQIARPLRDRELRRLVGAFLVAELGDGILSIVFPLGVYAATNSGLLTGLAFAVSRGSGLVTRPWGGVVADRKDRIAVLRGTVGLRVLAGMVGAANIATQPALALAAILVAGLAGSFENPAAEAAIRARAGNAIQEVSAIRRISIAVSYLVGPAVGGVAISIGNLRTALVLAMAAFVTSLALLAGVQGRPASSPPSGSGVRRALVEGVEGLTHIFNAPVLRLVALSTATTALLVSGLLTVAVVYLGRLPGAPDGAYGLATAAYSIGSVGGLLVAGSVRWSISLGDLLWRAMIVYGVLTIAGVVTPHWEVLALSWLGWGIAYGPEEILNDVTLVGATPDRLMARAYAGIGLVELTSEAVGAVLGGALAGVFDPRALLAAIGLLYIVVVAPAFWWLGRRLPDGAWPGRHGGSLAS